MANDESDNIWLAAADGHLSSLEGFLNKGVSPNEPDVENGSTRPLHAAASYGHLACVELLLSRGADPLLTDEEGDPPLHVVASIDCAKRLLKAGAQCDVVNRNGWGVIASLKYLETDPSVIQYLIEECGAKDESMPEEGDWENEDDEERLAHVLEVDDEQEDEHCGSGWQVMAESYVKNMLVQQLGEQGNAVWKMIGRDMEEATDEELASVADSDSDQDSEDETPENGSPLR